MNMLTIDDNDIPSYDTEILNESDLEGFKDYLLIWSVKRDEYGILRKVDEFVNILTGEIFKARRLKITAYDFKKGLERERIMQSLSKSQESLAVFLLEFRNNGGGFLIPISELLDKYSIFSKERKDSVKRTFKALILKEFMQDENTLNEAFMICSKKRTVKTAKGDSFRAGVKFDLLLLRNS